MSKKNYEAMANIILHQMGAAKLDAVTWPDQGRAEIWAISRTARSLADYFKEDNPRFDRARFLKACGVEE